MAGTPLSSYKRSTSTEPRRPVPDSPVLLWEAPAADEEADLLYTQQGARLPAAEDPAVFEVKKTAAGKAFPQGVTLGRMANNDIAIDARSISRFHAYFLKDAAGKWQVVDASKLGTWVDGIRVVAGKPMALKPRCRIRFGSVTLVFLLPTAFQEHLAQP